MEFGACSFNRRFSVYYDVGAVFVVANGSDAVTAGNAAQNNDAV